MQSLKHRLTSILSKKISKIVDEIGMDRIAKVVSERDGVEAQRLVLDMLK